MRKRLYTEAEVAEEATRLARKKIIAAAVEAHWQPLGQLQ